MSRISYFPKGTGAKEFPCITPTDVHCISRAGEQQTGQPARSERHYCERERCSLPPNKSSIGNDLTAVPTVPPITERRPNTAI